MESFLCFPLKEDKYAVPLEACVKESNTTKINNTIKNVQTQKQTTTTTKRRWIFRGAMGNFFLKQIGRTNKWKTCSLDKVY